MSYQIQLQSTDREFYSLIAQAVFMNPFSAAREELDRKLVGDDANLPRSEVLARIQNQLRRRLNGLQSSGPVTLQQFGGAEQKIMRSVFLFDVYHRFMPELDQLIQDQLTEPMDSLRVPFASQALKQLQAWGFNRTASVGYFALFYQVRRAYYFIDRSLIGRSACMHKLRERLWNNVFTRDIEWYERYMWNRMEDFSTLFLGETGTGKGAAAAAIGRSGLIPFDPKKNAFAHAFTQTFTSINLSQYAESLIESELFGHRKGAFTGAIEHHEGLLARCSEHGSVFLDEIGDVSPTLQVKLLEVLQERIFTPVGSREPLRFSGRVIAATNADLNEKRAEGAFRDDFYYRLCSDTITMPPLRQRFAEDEGELDELLSHLLQRMAGQAGPGLVREVKDKLARSLPAGYAWPGNVREFEQAVRRVIVRGSYEGDLRPTPSDRLSRLLAEIRKGKLPARELLAEYCALLHERHGTYEEVSELTGLDRRTVKKHIDAASD